MINKHRCHDVSTCSPRGLGKEQNPCRLTWVTKCGSLEPYAREWPYSVSSGGDKGRPGVDVRPTFDDPSQIDSSSIHRQRMKSSVQVQKIKQAQVQPGEYIGLCWPPHGFPKPMHTRAVLSQGEPRDAVVNFDWCRILQRHRAVSLPQYGFLV